MPKSLLLNIIFLPPILFIGFITSYEDFKASKIKNKWVFLGLSYSLLAYSLILILYKWNLINPYLLWNFDKWCINLLISSVVAYLLWYFKMWGAGDAKLFICYSSLIPIGQYSRVYFNYYFASFFLLLAIFIPATIFLILKSNVYFMRRFSVGRDREGIPNLIKEKLIKFNKIEAIKVLLGFFIFFFLFRILRQGLENLVSRFLPNQNVLMLISLLAFKPLSKFFKRNAKFITVAFIILVLYIGWVYSWEQFVLEMRNILGRTILITVLFPMLKKIIDLYAERTVRKSTPFAPWMLLGALITWFL